MEVYAAVYNMPQVRGWTTSDDPPEGYDLYCYPAKIMGSMIRALVRYNTADAIIIERGSVLSHSAVIAREMGIPLVVGVRGLTEQVHDGDKVRVDGINGTIEILERHQHGSEI